MDAEERELREILHGFPRGGEQMENEDYRRAMLDVLTSIEERLRELVLAQRQQNELIDGLKDDGYIRVAQV